MRIGMIVFSHTGNTRSVALRFKEKLSAAGHKVGMEEIRISGSYGSGGTNYSLESVPDPGQYDSLIFAGPVLAFSLSPVMKSYLKVAGSLQGKRVSCIVTQFLPFGWMGGNRAIRVMRRICESKGAVIGAIGIVNWSNKRREQQIGEIVDRLGRAFPERKNN